MDIEMRTLIVTSDLVERFGGRAELLSRIMGGVAELVQEYPDGSLQILTSDLNVIRILIKDPQALGGGPNAVNYFNSIAGFGGGAQILVCPYDVEERVFDEELIIFPGGVLSPTAVEWRLSELPLIVEFEKPLSRKLNSNISAILYEVREGVSHIDSGWLVQENFVRAPFSRFGTNCVWTTLNAEGLDQRAINWVILCVYRFLARFGRRSGVQISFRADDETLRGMCLAKEDSPEV